MTFENANFEVSENGQVESVRLADTLYPADDVSYLAYQDTDINLPAWLADILVNNIIHIHTSAGI